MAKTVLLVLHLNRALTFLLPLHGMESSFDLTLHVTLLSMNISYAVLVILSPLRISPRFCDLYIIFPFLGGQNGRLQYSRSGHYLNYFSVSLHL